ncbi:MAG: hypothetical protein H7Z14_21455 [Anaerolineae bacterium]|nr:hypothetical protein [Phycisphaerae bacterium]
MSQQMLRIGWIALLGIVGCQASVDTRPAPRARENVAPSETRVRSEAERIRDYALDIQNARDRIEEAAAIRRLNEYLADRNLTFSVTGQRAVDDARVQTLSASTDRLRVRVDTFRGQEPIQSFTFIPQDNRNLTLLGQ